MVSGVPLKAPAARGLERFDLSRIWRDVMDGLRFLREDSIASAMTAGIVIAFAAVGAVLALGPIFVNTTLHAKAAGWGVVVVAFGVGMAIGMAGVQPGHEDHRARAGVHAVVALGGGRALRAGRDAHVLAGRGRDRVARVVLRARVGERLHAPAGERRG